MQLRRATRQKSKLRIGISGTSGSGKTYSAIQLASGLTSLDKVVVIDTENGSADLYAHLGDFNVVTLEAPYSPERYIEAITACEQAGMEVIIVDSVTHEWDGKGGCLEINEQIAQAKFRGNTWSAWSQTTPRHQKFIDKIVTSRCHIITTARSKSETVQVDGKVKKVGTKEIQREGFEYELTVNFNLDRDGHLAVASKDRTELFIDSDPFLITEETGKTLLDWSNSGQAPIKPPAPPKPTPPPTPVVATKTEAVTAKQLTHLHTLVTIKGVDKEKMYQHYGITSSRELTKQKANEIIEVLKAKPDAVKVDTK